jgi:hypothetical protein
MESLSNTALSFDTKTRGFFNSIWPLKNQYYVEYDSSSFGIRKYTKIIKQGDYNKNLNCIYDLDTFTLNYNNLSVSASDSIQNIFTLLARVTRQKKEYLDAKWFSMNQEGIDYKARYLWVDEQYLGEVLCDRYKLDIELVGENSNQLAPHDYFTDNIASENAIRQIWVDKSNMRNIIKASVSIYGILVTAEIQ